MINDNPTKSSKENITYNLKKPAYACISNNLNRLNYSKINPNVKRNLELVKTQNKKEDEDKIRKNTLKEKNTYSRLKILNPLNRNNLAITDFTKNTSLIPARNLQELKTPPAAYSKIAKIRSNQKINQQNQEFPRAAFINTSSDNRSVHYSAILDKNSSNKILNLDFKKINEKKSVGKMNESKFKAFNYNSLKNIFLINPENEDLIKKDYKFNFCSTIFSKSNKDDFKILIKCRSSEPKKNNFNFAFLFKNSKAKQEYDNFEIIKRKLFVYKKYKKNYFFCISIFKIS